MENVQRISLKQFVKEEGVTFNFDMKIKETSENKIPFITAFYADHTADAPHNETLCFSKKASAKVTVGEDITPLLNDLQVVKYEDEESGEPRMKLSFKQALNNEELLALFA
jgi:hypothetical protein